MARVEQPSDSHGSLKNLQGLINNRQDYLNSRIRKELPDLADEEIIWQSPLKGDNYAEYRDNGFIKKVGLDKKEINLKKFWPAMGPQWDALATTSSGKIILVEAKAHISEIVSDPTRAKEKSRKLIEKSLKKTREYLGVKNGVDWTGKFYQYTNRIAHLYFLRVKKEKEAYLVNIYFLKDKSVDGPRSKAEWQAALQVVHSYLGLSDHKLSKYMADIFVDVNMVYK